MLAIFEHDGRLIPVLIEVKASIKQTLSFRPDYFERLKAYASVTRFPLLIAWKHHSLWTLFELEHMAVAQKNYNISLGKALSEGLLGVLAGDFSYTLAHRSGLHLRMRKDELLAGTDGDNEFHQSWRIAVEDVFHTDSSGHERRDLAPDVQALFFVNSLHEEQQHTSTHVRFDFTVGEDADKFAHMSLTGLLNWSLPLGERVNWRSVVDRPVAVPGVEDFARTVQDAPPLTSIHIAYTF